MNNNYQQGKKFNISLVLLLFVSLASIMLGGIWDTFIAPYFLSLPDDFSFNAHIISVDNFYDEQADIYSGEIYSKTQYKYETVSRQGDALLISNTFTVTTPDDDPIFSVERLYAIDQKTQTHISGLGDRERAGYLFAPRNLQVGEPFTYWHVNYDGPAHMKFVQREELYGLETYHYQTHYDEIRIDQTENLRQLPDVGVSRGVVLEPQLDIWVEPLSGRLIKYKDDTIAYYYDLQTGERLHPWNHFSNTFQESSVLTQVEVAQWERVKSHIFTLYIPIIFFLLGIYTFLRALRLSERLQKLFHQIAPQIVSIFLIFGAILSLLGWFFGIEELTGIIPRTSAMNPVTAFCFILLSGVVLLYKKYDGIFATLLSIAIILIAILRLFSLLGIISFDIDLLFFSSEIYDSSVPARMSYFTTISFLLLGIVGTSRTFSFLQKIRVPDVFSGIVFVFSLLGIIKYLLGSIDFFAISFFFSAAINTVVLCLCASIAMYYLFQKRDQFTLNIKGRVSVSIVLTTTILLTIFATTFLDRSIQNETRLLFESEVAKVSKAIEDRIAVYENVLKGARGFVSASEVVERHEWKQYVDSLSIEENYPGIQGVGYAIFVRPEEREAHEQAIRDQGFPNYRIRPEGERDMYTAITYLEPFDIRNQQAFGFDMFQEPVRRAAMERARDTGQPQMSGRITLVQEIDQDVQPGFLVYVPFYEKNVSLADVNQRRANIIGYTYSPFRARNFVEGAIGKNGIDGIGLYIVDGTNNTRDNVLYDDRAEKGISATASNALLNKTETIYVAGRPWTLFFVVHPTFGQSIYTKLAAPMLAIIGALVSILIAATFYALSSSRQRAVEYAKTVNNDLIEKNKELEKSQREVKEKAQETERINKLMVGRELKMIELKKKLKKGDI